MGDLGQPRNELVPQSRHLGPVLLHVGAGILQRSGHSGNAGDVLRTGPLAPLLCAALDETGDGYALPDIQSTYALGAVELVAGETQHIDVLGLDVNGQMSHCLYGVGVEQHARLPAYGADLLDGEDAADLVVGVHHRHQTGIRPDSLLHLLGGNGAGVAHRQQRHLEALLLQTLQGVEDGVVLKGGGDDVLLALQPPQLRSGQQRLIVGLTAAGGEEDLTGLAVQASGHGLTGALQQLGGVLAHTVQAGGVSVVVLQRRQHGGQRHRAHLGGSGIICVYHRDSS